MLPLPSVAGSYCQRTQGVAPFPVGLLAPDQEKRPAHAARDALVQSTSSCATGHGACRGRVVRARESDGIFEYAGLPAEPSGQDVANILRGGRVYYLLRT